MTRAILLLCLLLSATVARAQDDVAQLSLLPGWRTDSGTHMAAVQIRLAPGWKTYWRRPGEAGIPPALNWSGSNNVAGLRVHWPVPEVFWQAGMRSVGYADGVVLPVEIQPQRPGDPIELHLDMAFGVCRDICVPAEGRATASLTTAASRPDARIRAALADRPLQAGEAGVRSADCALDLTAEGARLTARFALPEMGGEEVVFEPSDPALWVSEPQTRREGGTLIATAEIEPPRGTPLMFDRTGLKTTIFGTRGAVEITGCN